MERRQWSPYEDQVLKNLYQKVQLNKWSLIASRMHLQFSLSQRTGKQCRQRYNNHLNPSTTKDTWTEEQQKHLLELHDRVGNKWAVIAGELGGRTDNGVKNHFFAKLRKSLRRINRMIKENFKKDLKEIKINVLYKIVEASEEKFKKEPLCTLQVSEFSCFLKNRILNLAEQDHEVSDDNFRQLIEETHQFSKTYKRKPKQLRRLPNRNQQFLSQQEIDHESLSGNHQEDSRDEIMRAGVIVQEQQLSSKEEKERRRLRSTTLKVDFEDVGKQPKGQAHNILSGILVEDESRSVIEMPNLFMRRKGSSNNLDQNSLHYSEFFEDSGGPLKIPRLGRFPSFTKKSENDDSFNNFQN